MVMRSFKNSKRWAEECKEELRDNYVGYFDKTTVHGLRYLTEPRRPWPERVLWFIGILVSLVACVWLMYNTTSRWVETPVIITMDEYQRTVWQIPFPAVTICPNAKTQAKYLNYTKLVTMYKQNRLTNREIKDLLAIQMVCNFPVVEGESGDLIDDTATQVIERLSLSKKQVIHDGCMNGKLVDLQPILTEVGVCFTSNMIPSAEFFREGTFHAQQDKYLKYTNTTMNWDPVDGYHDINDESYPLPASGLGRDAGLRLSLHTRTKELHSLCNLMGHGFKVILHNPIEFPQLEHESVLVPLDNVFHIMLTPEEVRTDNQLRHSYSPQQRQCYFPHERYLKYFKFYTQRNCELECLTNQTLRHCHCVEFYMPRMLDTPVCGRKSKQCVEKVKALIYQTAAILSNRRSEKLGNSRMDPSITCECLQSCSYTWYKSAWSNSQMDQAKRNLYFNRSVDAEKTNRSIVFIYYKDPFFFPIRRVEVFGNTDLLASLGGLMGLCMGISLLSVIEFFYWIMIRPFCQRIKQTNPQLRSIKKVLNPKEAEVSVQYSRHVEENAEKQEHS